MKRRGILFASLLLAACGTKEKAGAPPTQAASHDDALATVRAAAPAFASFGRARKGPASLEVRVPLRSDLALSLRAHGDEARGLSIRPLDLARVSGRSVEGATLYEDVAPSTDLLYAHDGDRVEEVRVLRDARARGTFRWEIEPGRSIVDLRVRDGRIEGIDAHGHVMVQAGEPFAVDRAGVRRTLAVSIAKKDDRFVVTASLEMRGLAFPVVVDPVWIGGPTMKQGRAGHTAATDSSGIVWLGCGSYGFDKYDPATDTITSIPDAPNYLQQCAITFVGTKVVVAGSGYAMSFDKSTSTWSTGATPTGGSSSVAVGLADGRILQIGGFGTGSNVVEVYDVSSDSWTTKASMKVGRANAMAIRLASGKVLVAGGDDGTGAVSSAEVYDPALDSWTLTSPMPAVRVDGGIARLPSGKIALAGGRSPSDMSTAIFDPATSSFTAGPTLLASRTSPGVSASADGRVFVFGGSISGESFQNSVDEIDATFTTIKAAPAMFVAREDPTATLLVDRRILVAGGRSGFGPPTASTELFSSFANGSACSWGGECTSGTCVDGVCCATTCGSCLRCDIPGTEGTCNPAPATTGCGSGPTCTGSTLAARGHCSGTDGTCVSATGSACAGGLTCADGSSCRSSCTADADCTTNHCDTASGLCLPPVPDAGPETAPADTGPDDTGTPDTGAPDTDVPDTTVADTGTPDTEMPDTFVADTATMDDTPAVAPQPEGPPKLLGSAKPCTSPSECDTGFCVDGVCCDSACKETCHSCALPGSPGRCSEEPLGVDLRGECGAALACSRTCGKGGVCTTSTKGTQCAPSVCTGPSSGKGAAYCVANGVPCPTDEQVPFDCGAYVCDPAFGACRTSCTTTDNCSAGYICDPTQKACVALPPEDSSGCAVSTTGVARGSGLSVLALLGLARLARRRSRRG
jgi:hypothetical protein